MESGTRQPKESDGYVWIETKPTTISDRSKYLLITGRKSRPEWGSSRKSSRWSRRRS